MKFEGILVTTAGVEVTAKVARYVNENTHLDKIEVSSERKRNLPVHQSWSNELSTALATFECVMKHHAGGRG